MSQTKLRVRRLSDGPSRYERQRLRALKESRRQTELGRRRLAAIEAALAAAQSSLRWLVEAEQTVGSGTAQLRDRPINLVSQIVGAAGKRAALGATIGRLEVERAEAAASLAESEARAVRSRPGPPKLGRPSANAEPDMDAAFEKRPVIAAISDTE